jgi:hypothetical protein
MKKIILTAVAVFGFAFTYAQENVIKANPLALLGGSDLVSYELKLGEKSSISLGAGVGGYNFGGLKYSTSGAELQYRYYFDEALKGWYAGAQAGFISGKVKQDFSGFFGTSIEGNSTETKFTGIKVGGKAGYQWVLGSGFVIDLNLGAAYNSFKYKGDGDFSTLKGSGVLPTFAVALGYAF